MQHILTDEEYQELKDEKYKKLFEETRQDLADLRISRTVYEVHFGSRPGDFCRVSHESKDEFIQGLLNKIEKYESKINKFEIKINKLKTRTLIQRILNKKV
jgi:hypothetical protein